MYAKPGLLSLTKTKTIFVLIDKNNTVTEIIYIIPFARGILSLSLSLSLSV